jgi:hypothetical protein
MWNCFVTRSRIPENTVGVERSDSLADPDLDSDVDAECEWLLPSKTTRQPAETVQRSSPWGNRYFASVSRLRLLLRSERSVNCVG